jgi:hypothetical protein
MRKYCLLCRCATVIERDSLITYLQSNGVEAWSEDRSVIVRVSQGPDLSLGGASAVLGSTPYAVWVWQEQLDKARQLIDQFLQHTNITIAMSYQSPWRYFYWWCLLSFFIPVVGPLTAVYYFVRALWSREKTSAFRLSFSMLLWLFGTITSYLFVRHVLGEIFSAFFH